MIRTLVHNKITKVVAVAGLVLVAFFVLHGHGASQQQTNVGHQTTVSATPCARSFKVRMRAPSAVSMCGREQGPVGVSRRGLGVRGGVVVVSLT